MVKDLVTNVSHNWEIAKRIPPFTPKPDLPKPWRMAAIDITRSKEFRTCIECFLCQDVCHVIRDHEGNKAHFAGPRFFVRAAALEMHPLDTLDRRPLLRHHLGLAYCNITKCCTEVCPVGIKITDNSIIPLKERVVDGYFDPIAWLGRKIRRKPARTPVTEPLAPQATAGANGPRPGRRSPGEA